jgi:hypothetical protein
MSDEQNNHERKITCLICGCDLSRIGYTYEIQVENTIKTIDFCETCEMLLFSEMVRQSALEQKFRLDIPCVDKRWMRKKELMSE